MTPQSSRPGRPPSNGIAAPQIATGHSTGAELLAELPTDVGLPAWEALRCVLKWSQEDPAMRGDLFEPTAMREWEVELLQGSASDPYACLAVLVGELAKLGDASPEIVAQTCICVTEWALQARFIVTALAFAEAAALSWPSNPRYAWAAGHLMHTNGRRREATVWLKHAERSAARQKDRQGQVLALRSLGATYASDGRDRDAAKSYRAALALARRHDVRDQLGELSHDLFIASANLGEWDEAEDHARAALAEYSNDSPRLPALAYDIARWWMTQGFYGRASMVLERLPEYCEQPSDRLRVAALLAGAAGAIGNADLFATAAREIWGLTAAPIPAAGHAFVELARGASALQQWDVAERALERLAELDADQGAPELAAEAEAVMDNVRMRRRTAPAIHVEDRASAASDRAHALATDLLATLRNTAQQR